ncbi:hypothetical protein QYF61_014385 [Mycteria americana]|uniref:Uncharacterized protein n=1 Tax=Mycteria americana TaxID=33587 RepID=A0AAN7P5L1_MYCAM|nr:hypothetical protein QYF61_014385 [Mycteria americana]
MVPDRMYTQVLRQLADAFAKPVSIIFERLQQSVQKKANVTPIFKKGKKEDLGNYRQVSPISIPGKVMEQLILETIYTHMKVKKGGLTEN